MDETHYGRGCRLRAEDREFARSLYGWRCPENVAWAAGRQRQRLLREFERRLRLLEEQIASIGELRHRRGDPPDRQPQDRS